MPDDITSGEAAMLIAFASTRATPAHRTDMRRRMRPAARRIADAIAGIPGSADLEAEAAQYIETARRILG